MEHNQEKKLITEWLYYIPETNTLLYIKYSSVYFLKIVNNFHLVRCQKNLEGVVFERILVKEQEFLYLNLAVILIWSKIVSKRISHSQVIKVKLGVSSSLGLHGGFPLAGHVTTEAGRQLVSSNPASLTFSDVCLSLLLQLGAQCFPT